MQCQHADRGGRGIGAAAFHRCDFDKAPVVALPVADERDQSIVMLRFFADFSCDEIAAVVDATPGAVRTALSRALSRLRDKFNPPVVSASPLPQTERGL